MEATELARFAKALGDPTRARIYQYLLSCNGPVAIDDNGQATPIEGPTAGEVCCQLTGTNKVNSTISFHLKILRDARLVTMRKRGKQVICTIDPESTSRLAAYFSQLLPIQSS